jgi:ribosomal protein S12 methylthiotransferase
MLGIVLKKGFELTLNIADADYLVLNTCGFLESARQESRDEIYALIRQKKKDSRLIVTGCMANLHKDRILDEFPQVDQVLSAGSVDKILDACLSSSRTVMEGDSARSYLETAEVPRALATPPHYAYLKIAEGCRKRCSFCIIPKIKGKLRSKPKDQVIAECQALVSTGVREIILIAQDLGDYGKDRFIKDGLTDMLHDLTSSVEQPDLWIRLLYLYPDEITNGLIDLMEREPRIIRYLDMPIQHISDRMLKRMKRKTNAGDIRQALSNLRTRLPGIHIRTSLMVGFPGETETDFQMLLDFVREAKLDNVGVFQYSNEELAKSSQLDGHIPHEVKQDRYDRLMKAQLEVVREKNVNRIGDEFDVVIESLHPDDPDLIVGRYYGQCPQIDGEVIVFADSSRPPEPGKRYKVRVTDFHDYDLVGEVIHN